MDKRLLSGLNEEQLKKIKGCKTSEDLLKVATEEGIKLTEEQLEAVNGGCGSAMTCPHCGRANIESEWFFYSIEDSGYKYVCPNCKNTWYS